MSKKPLPYKCRGEMIDGTKCNATFHRTYEGALRTAKKLARAYNRRRLMISTGVLEYNPETFRYRFLGTILDGELVP